MLEANTTDISYEITHHAQARMNQRSFSEKDIKTILDYGTWLDDLSVVLTRKDVKKATWELRIATKRLERQLAKTSGVPARPYKKIIQDMERLQNSKVVINGNTVVTCYHCSDKHLKRALRRAH